MKSDSVTTIIRFNDSRNVPMILNLKLLLADDSPAYYETEFHTNIAAVYYEVGAGHALWMYFEGVLPEEARDAE
jgi:hypothetical protein